MAETVATARRATPATSPMSTASNASTVGRRRASSVSASWAKKRVVATRAQSNATVCRPAAMATANWRGLL